MSKVFKGGMALYNFDPTSCHVKGEVKYDHILQLLFLRLNSLRFRIFSVLTIK